MRFLTWYLVLAECLVFFSRAQERHDACLGIEPIQDFQMSRFLGKWCAIQDTAMNGKCITYNYIQIQHQWKYVMVATEYISQADSSTFRSVETYYMIESSTPGRLETKYNMRNPPRPNDLWVQYESYMVFMTDYDTYAGVFKYLPNHEPRVTILSRTNTLDQMHVDKIRQKLSQCGFDLSNLKIIEHPDCPDERNSSIFIRYNDTTIIPV